MNKFIILILFFNIQFSFAAVVECVGKDQEFYYGDTGRIIARGDFSLDLTKIKKLELVFPDSSSLGSFDNVVKVDADYSPRSLTYKNHSRFMTADAWCGYSLLIPNNAFAQLDANSEFKAYLQQICESGYLSTASLICR